MRKLLFPLSIIYSLLARFRNLLYDLNIVKSQKAQIPAIVIGNLTVGGTGKTPHTIYIANKLKNSFQTAILSRGYKRSGKACMEVSTEHKSKITGDEPKLMKMKTGIPVFVCADRIKGINLIHRKYPQTGLVILDDAFQHRRLRPDLSIILIDYNRPVKKDIFLPAGNLRDNKYRLKQADIVIFTKCPETLTREQAREIRLLHGLDSSHTFFTTYKYETPYNPLNQEQLALDNLDKFHIVFFSGLGERIFIKKSLKKLSQNIIFLNFPDHHYYEIKDIKKIFRTFAEIHSKNKIILTTEKDWVKLGDMDLDQDFTRNLYILPVTVDFLFDLKESFNSKIYDHGRKLVSKSQKNSTIS